jgi:hypothetical protein
MVWYVSQVTVGHSDPTVKIIRRCGRVVTSRNLLSQTSPSQTKFVDKL